MEPASDRSTTPDLTPRQRDILRMVVYEYVQSGRAVGSKTLVEKYNLPISSATIRNEMAVLEEKGLLQVLHTSGGRVPTDAGYRFYVHHLMGNVELPPGDQIMIRHQFQQAADRLDGWVELAATVLASTSGNVSLVTAPRTAVPKLRHFELIQLQPTVALIVLVTFDSAVRQSMVHLDTEMSQEQLSRLADSLATDLRGYNADEIERRIGGADPIAQGVLSQLAVMLRQFESAEQIEIRHSGLEYMVGQPDVTDPDLQVMMSLVSSGGLMTALLPQISSAVDVQVFIGGDDLPSGLHRFGVVLSPYGVADVMTGVLGVLGPTRMSYWRTISTVRYMARLMSDLMAELSPGVD
ncbi:MAG: heat-inducible transcriptional repressor HrcA [Chloroflexota bacterium]|nr:heat-inducible transcriptional repressor HrcA [Chloroflexota bacterium]